MRSAFSILGITTLFLILLSCSKNKGYTQPPLSNPGTNVPGQKRYLALGDSYTIGQNVQPAERFPIQTKTWLNANAVPMNEPQIIATTGWSTINLLNAIARENPIGPFDAVSLLIGVNDQYQGLDTVGYRSRFTLLLQKSIALANNLPSHVFVVSIPDYSVTPYARNSDTARIRKEIDAFNEINKQISVALNTQYLDITPSTREAKDNPALLASDGLHPSGLEYKKWSDRLGPMMKTVLQ